MNFRIPLWTAAVAWAALMAGQIQLAAQPYPQAPLYSYQPPAQMDPANFFSASGNISLSNVPPSLSAGDASQKFDARAAAAILLSAYAGTNQYLGASDNGEGWQASILAMWAFPEYFNTDPQGLFRSLTYNAILTHQPGQEGTDALGGDEYEWTLDYYIPMFYRYYSAMPANVSSYMLNTLMAGAVLTGIPSGRSGVGATGDAWSEFIHIPDIIDIAETENHLIGIEASRYLINQLLYQQTQNPAYDNMRNGDNNGSPNTTDWILNGLQGFLKADFLEYNSRPYQDFTMAALLNLATYAYDDRVRISARMVLDYLSAKVAVSSCDLRRAPPFRRRNELTHYGPTVDGNFLAAPLTTNTCCVPDTSPPEDYGADPQIAYYSLLAGNTRIFFPAPGAGVNTLGQGNLPSNWTWEMVHAGVTDYRVPAPILDLFTTDADRQFYQYFHHYSYFGEYADELYAASPSYLISGGGHATTYAYQADVQVPAQLAIDAISGILAGPIGDLITAVVENAVTHDPADLGAAVPTVFMPAGEGTSLGDMVQLGQYTTDESQSHMGVAPDFACGDSIYLPPAIQNDPSNVYAGAWTFVNRGGPPGQLGYYLAIYQVENGNGGNGGLLEAYDTFLGQESFADFYQGVLAANPLLNLQFGNDQTGTYVTHSGQVIQFSLSPHAQILATTALTPAPADNSAFTAGSILNSSQGSGLITVSNPATGQHITLNMTDAFHPVRTDENGNADYAGEEVWVNFNFGNNSGDFGQPYRSLTQALPSLNGPAPAKTFRIISGTEHEAVTISKPVVLTAVGGPVTIFGQ